MQKLTIAATGLSGLVGSRIQELLQDDFNFINLAQTEMDLTDRFQVLKKLHEINFDILVHLAAYTNVDGAEQNRDIAYKINVLGTKHVFETAQNIGKKFIYVSTDFVFDGMHTPFFEDSKPDPISFYGKMKYDGEKIVDRAGMIIRISYPYRAHFPEKKDFVRNIIEYLRKDKKIKGVIDQTITLTFIDDIAYALRHLIQNFQPDIYHIVGADSNNVYDAIGIICEIFGLDKNLVSKTTYKEFYRGRAQRPKQGIIRSKKNNFYPMKTLRQGLKEIKKQLYV